VKISVVTATYNSVQTLADCLDSVRRQRSAAVEHIVIDGASRDGTRELLQARRADLAVFLSEPDSGIYDALNKGLARASGDVVGFLHSDDFYADDDVLKDVAAAFADPGVDAVYGDLEYVRKQDVNRRVRRWTAGPFRPWELKLGWMPPHPTLFVRRAGYQRIGGFDPQFRIAADYLSVLQLFSAPGFQAVYLPRVLVKMRMGGASNASLSNLVRKSREDLAALHRTGVGGPLTLIAKNLRKLPQFV
jgi:glycosyltransferase